jgi:molybdopterin/thiamine biosynthesis adenylyltransferase
VSFSDEELDRYARHIVLKEVGGAGQQALARAHVALVGLGGIGSPALQALAAAGVGTLTLIDDDHVERSNLQRQTIYGTDSIGEQKVAAAAAAARRINPHVSTREQPARLDANNAATLLERANVVIDGSDSFATRLAVADACLAARIPLVSAAVAQFEGQVATYRGWEADKPCYRCFVGNDPERPEVSCAEVGVLGAMANTVGSLAALEAMRAIVGFGEDSAGKLLLIDALAFRFRTIALPKDSGCSCAG